MLVHGGENHDGVWGKCNRDYYSDNCFDDAKLRADCVGVLMLLMVMAMAKKMIMVM